jgi:hypothetical protein
VRFNLTGDLNQEAMELMRENLGLDDNPDVLEAEIVKAPHHGSHDFDFKALKAMRPVVALCSSGDEHAGKEHIHPRATLMAALGKVMRQTTGVIFCTELAAFFAVQGECLQREDLAAYFKEHKDESFSGEQLRQMFSGKAELDPKPRRPVFGFRRSNFGIIHVRTDGERVLVFTHSGKAGVNEAYRFSVTLDDEGKRKVKFAKKVHVVTRSSSSS